MKRCLKTVRQVAIIKGGSYASDKRLTSLVLLIALAYSSAIIQGLAIKHKGVQKYICRVKESGRTERRHSTFYVGLSAQMWLTFREECADLVEELMKISSNKLRHYQRGVKAAELMESSF